MEAGRAVHPSRLYVYLSRLTFTVGAEEGDAHPSLRKPDDLLLEVREVNLFILGEGGNDGAVTARGVGARWVVVGVESSLAAGGGGRAEGREEQGIVRQQ